MKRRKAFAADEQVWKILAKSTRPVGAYQIADMISLVAASQIYRALERLVSTGKARRITARNAFVAATPNADAIALCRQCGQFAPLICPGAVEALGAHCANHNFQINQMFVEMIGICQDCRLA